MSRANAENADASTSEPLLTHHLIWALGSLCELHRQPFDAQLLRQQFPPPSGTDTLRAAAVALGFSIRRTTRASCAITPAMLPCLALSRITPLDEDGNSCQNRIVPELLKHRRLWQEVLLASLALQLLALGLLLFMLFSALLSWARQSLLLPMGNRIDTVLAMTVFKHLFCLSPRYFEQRPTGVIAARLHAVETIREFLASAAANLQLDQVLTLGAVKGLSPHGQNQRTSSP